MKQGNSGCDNCFAHLCAGWFFCLFVCFVCLFVSWGTMLSLSELFRLPSRLSSLFVDALILAGCWYVDVALFQRGSRNQIKVNLTKENSILFLFFLRSLIIFWQIPVNSAAGWDKQASLSESHQQLVIPMWWTMKQRNSDCVITRDLRSFFFILGPGQTKNWLQLIKVDKQH